MVLPRTDVVPSSHFKDEEAGADRQLHKVPRWGVGFNLVFLTPEAIVFSCSLLKCQNNCHMRVSCCQSGRPKTQSETAGTSACLLWRVPEVTGG